MFRSRKSSTISPLQPPASTDPSSKSMQSAPGQGQPQIQVQSPPPPPPLLPPSQYAHDGRGQAQGFPPPQPAYAGDGIGRASSAGTGASAGAERVKEKRRSGFGWLGGKKKDKEKEEREKINVSIYNKDPFFGIVASDLGESGGGEGLSAASCVPCLSPLGSMISVQWNYLFIYFIFLLIYIRIRRTVPVRRPFQSTAHLLSLRHVPFPPLPPKRSPSHSSPRRPYSPSRNTQPGHSHRTSGRRLRPDSHCAHCRQARSRGPKRTRASDHRAWILAICSSNNRASTGVVSAAGRGKDPRSHRWPSSRRQSTYLVQRPCRCSRPHPVPHPMAAQAPPAGDRRL